MGQLQLESAMEQLEQRSGGADTQTYAALLRHCGRFGRLAEGRRLHSHIVQYGSRSPFLSNLLVEMYGRCGDVDEAVNVFRRIVHRNVYSWNLMISAFVQNGQLRRARQTFDSMPTPDVVSWTTMVTAYARAGNMDEARFLFNRTPQRNQVAWSAMVNAYAQNGHPCVALELFYVMLHEGFKPDQATLLGAVSAVGSARAVHLATAVEDMARCSSLEIPSLGNALVTMYRKLGKVAEAKRVFDEMPFRDLVSWTSIIAAYAEHGVFDEAMTVLLPLMDLHGYHPDGITFITLHGACKELGYAKLLHALAVQCALDTDLTVANSMVTMYGRCGNVEDAQLVFDAMQERNVISWTAMVTANAQNGRSSDAVHLVRLMDMEGVELDNVAFVSVIDACADASAIGIGRCVQESLNDGYVTKEVQNALLNLHATCGRLCDARRIFDDMVSCRTLDAITWNTVMAAYARQGLSRETLDLWREMNLSGCPVNDVSFLAALSACSYAGALEDGCSLLTMMVPDFGLVPSVDHYACAVDLLARTSRLADAEELVKVMPLEPNHVPWFSLLTGCSDNADLSRGCTAAVKILERNSLV